MINGIPVTLRNEKGDQEKVVFASIRKCPRLRECILAEQRTAIALAAASRRAREALQKLDECPLGDLDTAQKVATDLAEAAEKAAAALYDARREFVVTGFVGAGYSAEDAERLTGLVEPDRLGELLDRCRIGAGRVDFS